MRMSRTITLTLVSAAMLTACVTSTAGCNRKPAPRTTTTTHTDPTWYDANGNKIDENWTTTEGGKRVPSPHPCDKHGKPWPTDADGNPVAPTYTTTHTTTSSTSHRSSGGSTWIFGSSGYRGSGPTSTSSSSSSGSVRSSGFGSSGTSSSS
jgi:hypothetical protein